MIRKCLLYRDTFNWKRSPYEYEYSKLPIDLIIGDQKIRQRIEEFDEIDDIVESWKEELDAFSKVSREFYLYEPRV